MREFADSGKHAGERQQHALDVVRRVHVRRVEPGDHRVEPRLLLFGERAVLHRDVGVGERVVVERRVGLQVVRGREVSRVPVRPGLLQRDAEQGRAPHLGSHDVEEPVHVDPFLDVVRQVEVRVVDDVPGLRIRGPGRRGRGTSRRGTDAGLVVRRTDRDGRRDEDAEGANRHRGPVTHGRSSWCAHQKFSSRFAWKTVPFAPTGMGYAV